MAEHSTCHPGRPGPYGESQAGSSCERLLPEHEVERIAFVWVVGRVAPLVGDGQHLVARDVAQLAELRIAAHRKVDVAAALVGVALVNERLDDLEHLGNVIRSANVMIGFQPVQVAHVLEVASRFTVAQLLPGEADLFRFAQDVVVDVGDVLNVGDIPSLVAHDPDQDIEGEKGEGVPDMGRVVRCDAADIEADRAISRRETLDPPRLGVEKLHSPLLRSGRPRDGSVLSATG